MVKPASSACNLRCSYCFYADEASIRSVPNYVVVGVVEAHQGAVLGHPLPLLLQHLPHQLVAEELIGLLIREGHRNIAGIFVSDNYQSIEKFQGMAAALQKNGVASPRPQ